MKIKRIKNKIICLLAAVAIAIFPARGIFAYAAEQEYNITNEAEFIAIAEQIKGGENFAGRVVHIRNNLNLQGYDWYSVIERSDTFNGIIDGHGHKIIGLNYIQTHDAANESYAGLLGGKLSTEGSLAHPAYDGAYAGVFNLYIEGSMEIKGKYAGALFGCIDTGDNRVVIKNVYADVGISSSNTYLGGLIGYNNGNDTVISGCVVSGNISTTASGEVALGGFVGRNCASKDINASLKIENSLFDGTLTGDGTGIGAFVGVNGRKESNATLSVSNCLCVGQVSAANAQIVAGTNNGGSISHDKLYVSDRLADIAEDSSEYPHVSLLGLNAKAPDGFCVRKDLHAVPEGVMAFLYAQSTSLEYLQNTEFTDGYCNLRFIGLLDVGAENTTLDGFEAVGFDITMTVSTADKQWTNRTDGELPTVKYVHTSIMANGEEYSADALGGNYIFVASVHGIKQHVGELVFEVRTFFDNSDGERVFSIPKTYVFNTNNGEWGGVK